MASDASAKRGVQLRFLLAGLEAGITGAIFMFLLSMAGNVLSRRSVWSLANLFSTTFYGDTSYTSSLTGHTWSGLALFLVIYGVLGMFWGVLARDGEDSPLPLQPLLPLWAGVFGVACFYFLFHFAWNRINPLIPLYAQSANLRAGHLLWGITLARSAGYAKRIAAATAVPVLVEDPAVKSGDVIV